MTSTNHNCSNTYFSQRLYAQFYCNADAFKPILDTYVQFGCIGIYETFVMVCGINENNEFCGLLEATSTQNITSYLLLVESQCQLENLQGCTLSCQTALNNFKTAVGCCVMYFNTTFPSATNPALWSAGGIPIPDFCPSTLISTNQRVGSTATPQLQVPSHSHPITHHLVYLSRALPCCSYFQHCLLCTT